MKNILWVWKYGVTIISGIIAVLIVTLLLQVPFEWINMKQLAFPISLILVTLGIIRLSDLCIKKKFINYTLDKPLKFLLMGLALSLLTNLIYGFFSYVGGYNQGILIEALVGQDVIYWLVVAMGEEFYFRGYLINLLETKLSTGLSGIIASILFASIHILNPDYRSIWTFLAAFLMGILLTYLVIKSKGYWLSIGFHVGWNWIQSAIGTITEPIYELFVISIMVMVVVCVIEATTNKRESYKVFDILRLYFK